MATTTGRRLISSQAKSDDRFDLPGKQAVRSKGPKSSVEMDARLEMCFLYAIKFSVKENELPLLAGTFYQKHMKKYCHAGEHLEIEKSNYKKLSKFLKKQEKAGIINVKTRSQGGGKCIVRVDKLRILLPEKHAFDDTKKAEVNIRETSSNTQKAEATIEDKSSDTKKKEAPVEDKSSDAKKEEVPIEDKSPDTKKKEAPLENIASRKASNRPVFTEMFEITPDMLPIFRRRGYKEGDVLNEKDVKQIINNYIDERGLPDDNIDFFLDKLHYKCEIMTNTGHLLLKEGDFCPIKIDTHDMDTAPYSKTTVVERLDEFGIELNEFCDTIYLKFRRLASVSLSHTNTTHAYIPSKVVVRGNKSGSVRDLLVNEYSVPRKLLNLVIHNEYEVVRKKI